MKTLLLVLLFAPISFASTFGNNSGDSIVCLKDASLKSATFWTANDIESVELVDLYYAKDKWNVEEASFNEKNWQEIVEDRMALLAERSYFYDFLRFAEENLSWKGSNRRLEPLPDNQRIRGMLNLPNNCVFVQLAHQDRETKTIIYDEFISSLLSPTHRAAFEIHERLQFINAHYGDGTIYGDVISTVALLFSKDFETLSFQKVNKLLTEQMKPKYMGELAPFWYQIAEWKYDLEDGDHIFKQMVFLGSPGHLEELYLTLPENAFYVEVIFLLANDANEVDEGELMINQRPVMTLFGREASAAGSSMIKMAPHVLDANVFRYGINDLEFAGTPGDFKVGAAHLRFHCDGKCEFRRDINWSEKLGINKFKRWWRKRF